MTTATLPALRVLPAWRAPGLAMLVYVVLLLLAYRGTATAMVEIWSRSETYTHAFVVPPIALWLIWRQRSALALLSPRPQPWMLLPLALLAAVWWAADRVMVNAAAQFALVGMLVAGVPALLGWAVARQVLFPLLFLFFAVPFGDFLTPVMMQYTADFTVAALRLTGIPVYREGQQFVIPSGHWSVVEACSGVRYLMASFMVGCLFAYLNYSSMKRRAMFMAVSIVVPIVANWLRAYIIVMLGHLSGNTIATGVDHIIYGWVFFGLVITLMFFVGARWSQPEEPVAGDRLDRQSDRVAASPVAALLVAGLAVLCVAWPHHLQLRSGQLTRQAPAIVLPAQLAAGWSAEAATLTSWRPDYQGASVEQHRAYRGPQGDVGVHVLYYRDQSADRKLISSVNVLVTSRSTDWNQLALTTRHVNLPGVPEAWTTANLIDAHAGQGSQSRQTLTLRRIYWIGGHWVAGDMRAKLWEIWLQLRAEPDDAAALILSAAGDPDVADRTLDAFTSANFDTLQRLLMEARGR